MGGCVVAGPPETASPPRGRLSRSDARRAAAPGVHVNNELRSSTHLPAAASLVKRST
jgi:hypothetical protein